jgi:NADPH-dependent ferric siderophore reductase
VRARALIEVADRADELPLETRADLDLTWVHRGNTAPNARLLDAALNCRWPDGRVHAFVHGELGAIRRFRPRLREDRGVPGEDLSISGYWRLGKDEDGFQAEKADEKRRAPTSTKS